MRRTWCSDGLRPPYSASNSSGYAKSSFPSRIAAKTLSQSRTRGLRCSAARISTRSQRLSRLSGICTSAWCCPHGGRRGNRVRPRLSSRRTSRVDLSLSPRRQVDPHGRGQKQFQETPVTGERRLGDLHRYDDVRLALRNDDWRRLGEVGRDVDRHVSASPQ